MLPHISLITLTEFVYPIEITKENIGSLTQRARQIKRKNMISLFLTATVFSITAMLFTFGLLSSIPYLPQTFNAKSEIETIGLIIGFVIIVIEFLVFVLFDLIETLINKALKLSYRESVFSSCILIANNLYSKNFYAAGNETEMFITSLLGFKRRNGREFGKEINLLSNGKKPFKRMLTFSEIDMPQLLLRFGSCIQNNDDALAYLFLKAILKETKEYGEIEGVFGKLERYVTSYKGITGLVISIITILLALRGAGLL